MNRFALAVLLVLAACKSKPRALHHTPAPPDSDAATIVSEAPPPPRHTPASHAAREPVDPSILAGATTIAGAALASVDATAAGPAPELSLLQRLGPASAGARSFELLLLIGRTTVLDLGSYRESILPDPADAPDGTLLRIPPIDPPRPWQLDDGGFDEAPLPAAGAVHFAYRTHLPGEADTFAIYETSADHLAVGHLHTTNADPGHPTWSQLAMITVAR